MNSLIRVCILLFAFSHSLNACDHIVEGRQNSVGNISDLGRNGNATNLNVCVCKEGEKCIWKCCPFGTAYNNESMCVKSDRPINIAVYDHHLKNVSFSINDYQLIPEYPCDHQYHYHADSDYHLLLNGHLHGPQKIYPPGSFCLENMPSETPTAGIFVCISAEPKEEETDELHQYGVMISIPFLAATLLVYAVIPELQNIKGKNLMSQLSAMIVSYTLLAVLQSVRDMDTRDRVCVAGIYIIQFTFLATFFWQNVMSYDLWFTFSGPGRLRGGGHRKHKLKFYFYSVYAWGSALIITAITILLNNLPNVPDSIIRPNINSERCWFEDTRATYAYFYGPIAVLLVANVIFFTITAWDLFVYQNKIQKVLKGSRKGNEENKQMFFLYCKLFFIMGINWIAEVISAGLEHTNTIIIILDLCNSLQGVLIFVIFVLKKRILKILMKKFGCGKSKQQQTGTSSYTSLQTNTNRDSVALHALGAKLELGRL